jgi:hypothetical protein
VTKVHLQFLAAGVFDDVGINHLPIAEGFEEKFWPIYPRKRGKAKARQAWRKVKPAEIDAIIARVELNNLAEWNAKEPRYIP